MDIKSDKRARKFPVLSTSLIKAIAKDIEEGSAIQHSADERGYTYSIFKQWRKQGRLDIEDGKPDTLPALLVAALGNVKQIQLKGIYKDMRWSEKGHRGAESILDRYFQDDFSTDAQIREYKRLLDEALAVINTLQSSKKDALVEKEISDI